MGEFEPILPLDANILRMLPKEGTLIAGAYPDGLSAKDIADKLALPGFDATEVSYRTRLIHHYGLAVTARTVRKRLHVYQITPKGEQFLRELDRVTAQQGGEGGD